MMTWSALVSIWKRGRQSAMLAGIFGTGIRFGANLLLVPVALLKLSSSELALWWVFVALGNFGNLADFGFGSTIPRVYNYLMAGAEDFEAEGLIKAKKEGKPNFAGILRLNATVQLLYFRISLVAVALLAVGGTIFLLVRATRSGIPPKVWWSWAIFVVAIGYNLCTYHWALALQGLNRMRDLQVVYIWGGLCYTVCAGTLLFCHVGLASMVVATLLKGFIMHERCRQIFRSIVPAPAEPVAPDPIMIKKLWTNTYKFGILGLSAFCMTNTSVLICSQLLGDEVTASYGVTAQIGNYMMAVAGLWLGVKWPEISILRTQGRLVEMSVLFARRLALVMLSFVGLSLLTIFAGNTLLAWKGAHARLLSAPYLLLYLANLAEGTLSVQFGLLAFTENVVPFFRVAVYTGIGVVMGSLILTPIYGLWGLVAAPLLADLACNFWFTIRCGFKRQELNPCQFMLAAVRGHA